MKKIYYSILLMLISLLSFSQVDPFNGAHEIYYNYSLFSCTYYVLGNQVIVNITIDDSAVEGENKWAWCDFGDGNIVEVGYQFTHYYSINDPRYMHSGIFSLPLQVIITADVCFLPGDEEGNCLKPVCYVDDELITFYGDPPPGSIDVDLIANPCCDISLGETINFSFVVSTSDNPSNLEYDLKVNGSSIESDFISISDLNTQVNIDPYEPAAAGTYIFTLDIYQLDELLVSSSPVYITITDEDSGGGSSGTCFFNNEYPEINVTYTVNEDSRRLSVEITDVSSTSFKANYAGCGKYWLTYLNKKSSLMWYYLDPCTSTNPMTDYAVTGFPDYEFTLPAVFGSNEPGVFGEPEIFEFIFAIESKFIQPDGTVETPQIESRFTLVVPPKQIEEEDNEIEADPLGEDISIETFLPNGVCYSTISNNPLNKVDHLDWVQDFQTGSDITFTVPPNIDDQPREVAIKIYPPAEYSKINTVINGQQMNYRLVTVTQAPLLTYIDPNRTDLIALPDFSYPPETAYFGLMQGVSPTPILSFKDPDRLPYLSIMTAIRSDAYVRIDFFDENRLYVDHIYIRVYDYCWDVMIADGSWFSDIFDGFDISILKSRSSALLRNIAVNPGNNVVFFAKDEINLVPPFTAKSGSEFLARIGDYCFVRSESLNEEIIEPDIETIEPDVEITKPIAKEVITEVLPQEEILVYPNPTDGLFTVELININDVGSIEIFGSNGTKTKIITPVTENIIMVDLTSYSAGIYLLKFNRKNSIEYRKVIVR